MNNPLDKLDERRTERQDAPATARDFARRRMVPLRSVAVFAVFLVILAAAWRAAPYIRSLVVRDAVVTTWTNLATAPINGIIRYAEAALSEPVGADGIVAVIENVHLTRAAIDNAQIRVERAHLRVRELETHLDELKALDEDRAAAKARYADQFRTQLDTDIVNLEAEIATAKMQLEVLKKIAERASQLAERGTVSRNEADEAELRVSALEVRLAGMDSELRAARLRRGAADSGIFITGAGTDPNWVFDWRMDLKMAKKAARLDLRHAQAELAAAEAALAAAQADFRRLSGGTVTAPPGSVVWSRRLASGSTVRAGDPVAEWIDCSTLLVVVPVPNFEMPLITRGMTAELLLDGETAPRRGAVILTRGSSSPFNRSDVVAVPTDRRAHSAEVVIDISEQHADFAECPVGRSAFVDFPQIGMLDIAWAWLRL